jgi:hypothetical protein
LLAELVGAYYTLLTISQFLLRTFAKTELKILC